MRTLDLLVIVLMSGVSPAWAQDPGNQSEASDRASSIGGNVTDSSISVVYGIPIEAMERLVTSLSSDDPELREDALELLRAQLPQNTQFRIEAIANLFEILGHEEVPPERLADTFAQIASENLQLRERLQAFEGDDPAIGALREAEELIAADQVVIERVTQRAQLIAEQAGVERSRLNLAAAA